MWLFYPLFKYSVRSIFTQASTATFNKHIQLGCLIRSPRKLLNRNYLLTMMGRETLIKQTGHSIPNKYKHLQTLLTSYLKKSLVLLAWLYIAHSSEHLHKALSNSRATNQYEPIQTWQNATWSKIRQQEHTLKNLLRSRTRLIVNKTEGHRKNNSPWKLFSISDASLVPCMMILKIKMLNTNIKEEKNNKYKGENKEVFNCI